MKKTSVGLVVVLLFALAWRAWCVTQAQRLGTVSFSLNTMTAAQVAVSTSTKAGEMLFCSNCTANGAAGTICVSTGTTGFNPFVLSTGTICR